jgi:hypothetical protein
MSYDDSAAARNPGQLYLSITDNTGTLSATDSEGPAAGSGSNAITLSASYLDVADILNNLTYTAPAASGFDAISFDIWDQAGTETTGSIPVTIVSGGGGKTETWTGAASIDWNTPANWSGGAMPTSGDTVVISPDAANEATLSNDTLSGETITLSGASVSFIDVTLDSVLQALAGSIDLAGTLTIGSHGTFGPQQGGTLFVGTNGSAVPIVNNGVIRSPAGSTFTVNNGGTVFSNTVTMTNNGIISADGGKIGLDFAPPPFGSAPAEALINSGSIAIANGGGLTLNGMFVGNSISMSGTGAVGLQQPDAFAADSGVTGFGQGDQIDLYGTAKGGPIAFSNGVLTAGATEAIPLAGSYGLGNFENESIGGNGNPQIIAYAPDAGPSGIVQPDIIAPVSATVAQGATLTIGQVSINNLGTTSDSVGISAVSGTLYMKDASGSGTNRLSLGPTPPDQINADLATLNYVPAVGAGADTVGISVTPPAPVTSSRSIPITVTNGGSGPNLHEPSSETVSSSASVTIIGRYTDSFAQGNPGSLFLSISDRSGTLSANDASGNSVSGSGTNSISISTNYTDLNAVLQNLTYVAGSSAGPDTISFDIWNQEGDETTDCVPVTVTGASGGGLMLNEPSGEAVSPNSSVAISGSYSDSFAQGNPGQLFLGISDGYGTLSATDAAGNSVAGSGTSSIALSTDYVDLNAILANLHYTAGATSGSDQISFDIWNQAGVETTATTSVTIDPSSASMMASAVQPSATEMASNFAVGATVSTMPPPTATAADMFALDSQSALVMMVHPGS